MTYPPIIIAGPIYGGSELVSSLLMEHEVTDETPQLSKTLINATNVPSLSFLDEVNEYCKQLSPWLINHTKNLHKWQQWYRHFPEAKWVLTRRATKDCISDAMKFKTLKAVGADTIRRQVRYHKYLQKIVEKNVRHAQFFEYEELTLIDLSGTKKLFDFCGVEMDESVCVRALS